MSSSACSSRRWLKVSCLFVFLLFLASISYAAQTQRQQHSTGTHHKTGTQSSGAQVAGGAGNSRTITFVNNCTEKVWWGVVTNDRGNDCGSGFYANPANGGGELAANGGRQTITVNLEKACGNNYQWSGNFYGRTGCKFVNGIGLCETGGCADQLYCKPGVGGNPPKTLTEFTFKSNDVDIYDVSNVDGSNVPIKIRVTNIISKPRNDKYGCGDSVCLFDFRKETGPTDQSACLNDLKARNAKGDLVGCKSACTAFDAGHSDRMANSKYCCTGSYFGPKGRNNYGNCPPTSYSQFFKSKCSDAYSWPQDDNNSTYACVATAYEVTFCAK